VNQVLKHPDFKFFLGIFAAMVVGSLLVGGAGRRDFAPIGFYLVIYLLIIFFQVISYTLGIAKTAVFYGSGASALRGFASVSRIAIPLYLVVFSLFFLDASHGWRLVTNPLSAILFFFSLNFLVARAHQRTQATALLRGANPTGEHGVAAQRRPVAPDFSAVQPSTAPSPSLPPHEAKTPQPKPGKAPARSTAEHDPFADAVRPNDEDE